MEIIIKMYERTKDEFHLNYASYIRREQERGEDHNEKLYNTY